MTRGGTIAWLAAAVLAASTAAALSLAPSALADGPGGGIQVVDPPGVSVGSSSTGPATSMPEGWVAPDGVLSYTLNLDPKDYPPGSTVTVPITGLSTIPQSLVQVDSAGRLTDLTPEMTVPAGQTAAPYTIDLTLTDGGLGDEDGVANDQIVDPLEPLMAAAGLTPTTTGIAVTGSVALQPVTFTATIGPPAGIACPGGSVVFTDQLFGTPIVTNTFGPVTLDVGTCTATVTTSILGAGFHIVSGVYTPPSNCTNNPFCGFTGSIGSVPYILTPPTGCNQPQSQCTDQQSVQGTVPVGTLTITTPYTVSHPLDLGTLALTTNDAEFSATASFQNIVVTDTRSGDLPWTITALASDLSDGGTQSSSKIDSQNVGLTALVGTAGAGFAGTVTGTNNPAASPPAAPGSPLGPTGQQGLGLVPHTVAATAHGLGSYSIAGTLTVNAPTSTEAGLFAGTITFTVG